MSQPVSERQLTLMDTRDAAELPEDSVVIFLRRHEQRYVLSPDRALTTAQINISVKLRSGESSEFVEVTGIWVRGCLAGVGMIPQLHH